MALERLLKENGIEYLAEIRLAPTQAIRELQKRLDAVNKATKNSRLQLSDEFCEAYREAVLSGYSSFDIDALIARAGNSPALLCVERAASACHRSMAATWLAARTNGSVVDLTP